MRSSLIRRTFGALTRQQKHFETTLTPRVHLTPAIYFARCRSTNPSPERHYKPSTPADQGQDFAAFEQLGGERGTGHDHQQEQDERDHDVDEDEERFKSDLLSLAVKNHVKAKGWSREAISAAASEAGLSPAVASMFSDADLVHHFISQSNQELEDYLKDVAATAGGPPVSLKDALKWRLEKITPYASNYAEAIALISRPENVQTSVGLLMDIADSIAHRALKDTSADLNWYSKRIGIAGIYVATELCLVQDQSEGFSETWKFLDRRCQEFNKYGKGELPFTSFPLSDLLHTGYVTLLNVLGRNSRR